MADPIIIRIPRRAANVALAALVLISVVTFTVWADRGPGAAEARAERYLTALVSGDARTAWDQLTDRVHTIWGTFDAFEAAVRLLTVNRGSNLTLPQAAPADRGRFALLAP